VGTPELFSRASTLILSVVGSNGCLHPIEYDKKFEGSGHCRRIWNHFSCEIWTNGWVAGHCGDELCEGGVDANPPPDQLFPGQITVPVGCNCRTCQGRISDYSRGVTDLDCLCRRCACTDPKGTQVDQILGSAEIVTPCCGEPDVIGDENFKTKLHDFSSEMLPEEREKVKKREDKATYASQKTTQVGQKSRSCCK
jgi:hypothetical protein